MTDVMYGDGDMWYVYTQDIITTLKSPEISTEINNRLRFYRLIWTNHNSTENLTTKLEFHLLIR